MNATVSSSHELIRNARPIESRARFDRRPIEGAHRARALTPHLTFQLGSGHRELQPASGSGTCVLPRDCVQLTAARSAMSMGRPLLSPGVDSQGRTVILAYMPRSLPGNGPGNGQFAEVRLVSMLQFGDDLHRAARDLGTSNLAARVCRTLVEHGSLRRASRALGISHQTASSEIKDAMRLAGVNSQSGLVHRLADRWLEHPLCGDRAIELLQSTFSLSLRDARVACLRAVGYSRQEAAAEMGVSQWAMETSCANVFATLGASKAPELTRIVVDLMLAADLADAVTDTP